MAWIPITGGLMVEVDDEDEFWLLSIGSWYYQQGYAYFKPKKGLGIYMHKLIAKEMELSGRIDHIDRNKLNNKRNNLRAVTVSQNNMNKSRQSNNTSGYTGIIYDKRRNKYYVEIKINNKRIFCGSYSNIEEAVRVRREAVIYYFGEYGNIVDY